jgi:hypothetical protein
VNEQFIAQQNPSAKVGLNPFENEVITHFGTTLHMPLPDINEQQSLMAVLSKPFDHSTNKDAAGKPED